MALNPVELKLCKEMIDSLQLKKVLSLGYPDLLIKEEHLEYIFNKHVDIKIHRDSDKIAKDHGRPGLPIYDAFDLFSKMGVELETLDTKRWNGRGIVHNMNIPIPDGLKGGYQFLIDLGTLEHCFNIAQAMKNISELLCVGGVVYHQNPLAFVNHGFYSISPTFYNDYYRNNGFSLLHFKYWDSATDKDGLMVNLKPLESRRIMDVPQQSINVICARKDRNVSIIYPIQSIYK